MTRLAVDGLRAERDAMLDVLASLDDDEWVGVREVVEHVASTHHRAVAPQLGDWPVICSDAHDFTVWGTRRRAWREYVTIEGDETAAATFLDAIAIV